jgi:uncharacterized cupin superfamily protein
MIRDDLIHSAPASTSSRAERSLSVRIGRIAVRLALLGLIIWGGIAGYQSYRKYQRAQEVAPVHAYAFQVVIALKNRDYFSIQDHLDPAMHHTVSIDWLAYFAEHAELNATRTGTWGEWNITREANASVYHLEGRLVYANNHSNPMRWQIKKEGDTMYILDLTIGKWSIKPPVSLSP